MDEQCRGVAPGGRTAQIGPGGVATPRFCWRKETCGQERKKMRKDVISMEIRQLGQSVAAIRGLRNSCLLLNVVIIG